MKTQRVKKLSDYRSDDSLFTIAGLGAAFVLLRTGIAVLMTGIAVLMNEHRPYPIVVFVPFKLVQLIA